jgi:GATA-binding protein 4
MFHSTPSYSTEMTSVAAPAASYHQTNTTANTPVYVPSNRAISHAQYGHAGNYTNTQNGWPAESTFGKTF